MELKYILFDLDGTLLPMDQDVFVKAYFKGIAAKLYGLGYNPDELIAAIWKGTAAMVKNDGKQNNEAVFWEFFKGLYGEKAEKDKWAFDEFYLNDFPKIKEVCGYNKEANELVKYLKDEGYTLVLATNPIFPSVATENRMLWAGLDKQDFLLYTTYENSNYCKPNPMYYKEILDKIGCKAEQCLMVGNDVDEDMVAQSIGMKVFLLTDSLINKQNKDISVYERGSFSELKKYIEALSKQ